MSPKPNTANAVPELEEPRPDPAAPLSPWTASQLATLRAMCDSLAAQVDALREQVRALTLAAEAGGDGIATASEPRGVDLNASPFQRALNQARRQAGQGPEFYGSYPSP